MERHVALAADGHAEGTVAEHLDAHLLSAGTADVLFHYLAIDVGHLVDIQFAGQYNHVGKLRIEAQRLDIGDVQLCRQVNLLPHSVTIGHHRHVAGDDGRDACCLGGIDNLVHQFDVLTIDDGVHREVRLDAVLVAGGCNLFQVVNGERRGGVGSHVQFLDAEIDGVSPGLYGSGQRLAAPHGRHDFKIFDFHGAKVLLSENKTKRNLSFFCVEREYFRHLLMAKVR